MFPTQSDPTTWFDCRPTHPPIPPAILELERAADAAWEKVDELANRIPDHYSLAFYALLHLAQAEWRRLDDALQAAKREQHEPEVHRGAAIAAECGVRVDDD